MKIEFYDSGGKNFYTVYCDEDQLYGYMIHKSYLSAHEILTVLHNQSRYVQRDDITGYEIVYELEGI